MNTQSIVERKRYLKFSTPAGRRSRFVRLLRRIWSVLVLPYTLVAAQRQGVPGIGYRVCCIGLGLRALLSGDVHRSMMLVTDPMDSFRYFELEFAVIGAQHAKVKNYLDVSSPRLVAFLLLKDHPELIADLLNPVPEDLCETMEAARSMGIDARCRPNSSLIEVANFPDASFDLITSISVIEHIPGDCAAVARMWNLLRPGGKLIITVPCAKEWCEEYTNLDEYSLLSKDTDGYVYWQRYYDEALLTERIWSVTGRPTRSKIYGEIKSGNYDTNVQRKRTDPSYPYWKEPIMLSKEYRYYDSLGEMPGMGVIAMEFTKPLAANEGGR